MNSATLLVDAFERVRDMVRDSVMGLSTHELAHRLDADANTVGWLVWHLTRIQDDQVAEVAGIERAWTAQGWMERFGLPFKAEATGYGHSSDEVAAVRVERPELLVEYHEAVFTQTRAYIAPLINTDLDRVVDTRWDPPVTLGVRLVSVLNDATLHAGQAAFVRGIIERQRR